MSKELLVDGKKYRIQIWDTAGQEKYHSLAPMYYRGAAAAIVVYDITRKPSYATLQTWVEELKKHGPPNIVLAVAGNKSDLEDRRSVPTATAESYASSIGAIFSETSAKDDTNVISIFENVIKALPAQAAAPVKAAVTIVANEKPKGGCC
jgi:Ras-related protein Rab-22